MSMFLSKFLTGRNSTKSKLELLTDAWRSIQKYYETATDPLKDAVDLTPIPCCLQTIVKLIQAEEVDYQRSNDSLETGPCLEYLLQKRVLEELVEFAKVDTPYGMRIHCLRFFCNLVVNVNAQLLPERAVHVPLQKLINACHRLIAHHYEQLVTDDEPCPDERHVAISELSLELVKLMHGVFSHFKGTNAALMDLFFERGWCRGLGENVWMSSKDGKRTQRGGDGTEKLPWNLFLTPRFDMFSFLMDYINIPGETGEIARESVLFALRLLDGDPEYVCYVVEYSGLCEIMAERLAIFFAKLPKNAGAFNVSSSNRVMPVRPPKRRIRFSVPATITNNNMLITVNAHQSFKKKRRKRSPFDNYFCHALDSMGESDRVDEFYSFWEYLNDVARVADKRLMTALMAQLTAIFWHPVVCTALSSPSADLATVATAYTTEMIRSLTDQKLLHTFLVVLIGEEGGVSKDLEPETRTNQTDHDLIDGDDGSLPTDEDEDDERNDQQSRKSDVDEEMTLRVLLINRIHAEHPDLSLATLRMFDTIIETYNQFAIYNLILRNYLDISPDGEYLDYSVNHDKDISTPPPLDIKPSDKASVTENGDTNSRETTSSEINDNNLEGNKVNGAETSGSETVNDKVTNSETNCDESNADETNADESVTDKVVTDEMNGGDDSRNHVNGDQTNGSSKDDCSPTAESKDQALVQKQNKFEKVRWIVERILSLLPLDDELERIKSPPLPSVISSESLPSTVHGSDKATSNDEDSAIVSTEIDPSPSTAIPGNSYDDYFHEARERFQYGLVARNFWRFPYPPPKSKRDFAREAEDRRGRPQRRPMSMIVSSKDAAMHRDHGFDDASADAFQDRLIKNCGSYEGLFLSRLFDLFFKLLELPIEQNLLVTSILQKIASIVDKRVDGILCDWRAIRVGGDGALYGGVWALPNANGSRRSLYSLLEQVTFEALKRAQLVPNFETRISLAKKRGVQTPPPDVKPDEHSNITLLRSTSTLARAPSPREPNKSIARNPSLSHLVFSKGSPISFIPESPTSPQSPISPLNGKSGNILSFGLTKDNNSNTHHVVTHSISVQTQGPNRHSGNKNTGDSFFQKSQRTNMTPITMTNPFAKFSNFVNAYIVLQEFCKELAAVILVRHATEDHHSTFVEHHDNAPESRMGIGKDFWFDGTHACQDDPAMKGEKGMDRWKNRYSMIPTVGDWKNSQTAENMDETNRVRSISNDA